MNGMRDWVSFAEIKKRITLEQVLRSYEVDWLRHSGIDQYRGRCPIHHGQAVRSGKPLCGCKDGVITPA